MLTVEIRLKGKVARDWSEWLEGFTITYNEECETILTGQLPDQSALYGLIGKLRDLGIPLQSICTQNQLEGGNDAEDWRL